MYLIPTHRRTNGPPDELNSDEPMTITSQHNPALKQLRRLARKHDRERSGRFAAEGEDLIAAAELAGRRALEGYRVAGSGLGGESFIDVEASALGAVSTLGSGTRVIGVYEQCWAAGAEWAVVRVSAWCRRPGERRHGAALGEGVRREQRGAWPGLRRSACAEGREGEHGRDLRRGDRPCGVDR